MSRFSDALFSPLVGISSNWQSRAKNPRSLALVSLLFLTVVLSACGSDEPERVVSRGRSLELHATKPVIVDKVAFLDGLGQHRVVRPKASNRQLALVEVTIVNRTALVVPLLIDPEAAQIGDRRGARINALDPFTESSIVDDADPEEEKYSPLLWGDIELDKEFQVQGWMIFDVPKGLILGSIWWDEVDMMIADFIEYKRRRR